MDISTRIQQRRKELGLTLKDVALALGASESLISRYESGNVKNFGIDKLVPLSKVLKTTPAYLMGWEEAFQVREHTVSYTTNTSYNYAPVSVSAGLLESIEPLTEFDKIEVPSLMLGKYANDKHLLFMHVNGESMNNIIEDKALIAVKRNVNLSQLKNGDIVVIATDEGYTVKRFYNDKDNSRFIFRPDSKDLSFLPIIRTYEEDTRLIGKVVMYNVIL